MSTLLRRPEGLAGHVLTPDGAAAQGAKVVWIVATPRVHGRGCYDPVQIASTTSEADGRFSLPLSDELVSEHWERPWYARPHLLAEAPGWGLTFASVQRPRDDIEILLRPAADLEISFVDLDGNPLAGVRATVHHIHLHRPLGSIRLPPEHADGLALTTDGSGGLSFRGLPQGAEVYLSVEDERFADQTLQQQVEFEHAPVTRADPITLLPGATISGRVVYGESGEPAAGIVVSATARALGVTDTDGRYTIKRLAPGRHTVHPELSQEMAKSRTARAHETLRLAMGERKEGVDFTLIRGGVIAGRVLGKDTGDPIVGTTLRVSGPPSRPVEVESDGSYFLRVPEGEHELSVSPPAGFVRPADRYREVQVRSGDRVTLDFELPGALMEPVYGRVLGPDGQPAAAAEALLGHGPLSMQAVGADGAFYFEPRAGLLWARMGMMGTEERIPVGRGGEFTLRLKARRLGAVSGAVVDREGSPIAGARVQIPSHSDLPARCSPIVTTDAEGRFRIAGIWPGEPFSVAVQAKGYDMGGHKRFARDLLDPLSPGEERTLDPIVLHRFDSFVAGSVVDPRGEPVVGARIYGDTHRSLGHGYKPTDHAGRFRIPATKGDTMRLIVAPPPDSDAPALHVPSVEVAGQSDVVIVLEGCLPE